MKEMLEKSPPYNDQRDGGARHACAQRVVQFEVRDFAGVPSSGRFVRAQQKTRTASRTAACDSPMGAGEAGRVREQRGRLHPAPARTVRSGETTLHEQRVWL